MSGRQKGSGWSTAGEILDRLEKDPVWVARRKADEEWRQARARRLSAEEAQLVADLAEVGVVVSSVWDLVNTRQPYPEAIPVLLDHLKISTYRSEIRDGIARALTVKHPETKAALPELLAAFRRDPEIMLNGAKWALGNAICVLFDDRHVEEVAELARDPAHGPARGMLLRALAKSNSESARTTREALRDDPDSHIAGLATQALERWHRKQARRRR